jgi:hypothetical protein
MPIDIAKRQAPKDDYERMYIGWLGVAPSEGLDAFIAELDNPDMFGEADFGGTLTLHQKNKKIDVAAGDKLRQLVQRADGRLAARLKDIRRVDAKVDEVKKNADLSAQGRDRHRKVLQDEVAELLAHREDVAVTNQLLLARTHWDTLRQKEPIPLPGDLPGLEDFLEERDDRNKDGVRDYQRKVARMSGFNDMVFDEVQFIEKLIPADRRQDRPEVRLGYLHQTIDHNDVAAYMAAQIVQRRSTRLGRPAFNPEQFAEAREAWMQQRRPNAYATHQALDRIESGFRTAVSASNKHLQNAVGILPSSHNISVNVPEA